MIYMFVKSNRMSFRTIKTIKIQFIEVSLVILWFMQSKHHKTTKPPNQECPEAGGDPGLAGLHQCGGHVSADECICGCVSHSLWKFYVTINYRLKVNMWVAVCFITSDKKAFGRAQVSKISWARHSNTAAGAFNRQIPGKRSFRTKSST